MSDNDRDTTFTPSSYQSLADILASDDELLTEPQKPKKVTSTDRLERSFLEIVEFVQKYDREPSATTRDIAERKLGARLDGIRSNPDKIDHLRHLDSLDLLAEPEPPASLDELLSSESAVDELGLLEDPSGLLDTTALPVERRKPLVTGPGARREKCEDFELFAPLFQQKHAELDDGTMKLVPFQGRHTITPGAFFVLNGMMTFVAEVGETEYIKITEREERRERLRLIFDNGTESAMYRQSFSLRLGEGDGGYQIVPAAYKSLLADDEATGWIYVLRSLSDDPQISTRENLYKIGFTTTPIDKRIRYAITQPTYLMAPVEVVETYRTYNVKSSAIEHLLHRIFAEVRLQISQTGVDGRTYDAREWFQVPLPMIRKAAELITNGEIIDYTYDTEAQKLLPIDRQ
jgi:hypothetical protein